MICTRCGRNVNRVSFLGDEILCTTCRPIKSFRNAVSHEKAGNPHKPWLTKAGNDIITHRTVSRDDNRTVIDSRTGRETQFVTKD